MTRSCRCRGIIPVLAFAVLVGFSATYAQELEGKNQVPLQDEDFVLEIIDKQYNEETGDLLLVLRNNSDLTVTAFGVSYVSEYPSGGGSMGIQSEDKCPGGDGIAPGASYELKVALGDPSQYPTTRFAARSVKLDHEIRSDNTSYGNTAFIDSLFEDRTAYFLELGEALTRLRERTSGSQKSVLPLFKEDTEEGKEARRILWDPHNRHTPQERARLSAVASIADMTEQTARLIETGQFPQEEAVALLDQFLENELANASRNIRPVDLERFER